ncbi:MAG: CDP-alcohol phosphatidyltransferase family protein [Candidatus Levyibacteriota bacterium]
MLTVYKKLAETVLEPTIKPLSKVNPNTLTLLGSIPSLLFFVFVLNHWYIAALIAFLGNGFDLIDGMVARKYNHVTNFGGFLDSTMDRVADFFLITAFAFGGIVRWEIVAPLLLFAYLTSYIRSRGELANRNVSFAVGIVERTERLALLFVSLLVYALSPNMRIEGFNTAELIFLLITLLSLYTVIQRFLYAYKKL